MVCWPFPDLVHPGHEGTRKWCHLVAFRVLTPKAPIIWGYWHGPGSDCTYWAICRTVEDITKLRLVPDRAIDQIPHLCVGLLANTYGSIRLLLHHVCYPWRGKGNHHCLAELVLLFLQLFIQFLTYILSSLNGILTTFNSAAFRLESPLPLIICTVLNWYCQNYASVAHIWVSHTFQARVFYCKIRLLLNKDKISL